MAVASLRRHTSASYEFILFFAVNQWFMLLMTVVVRLSLVFFSARRCVVFVYGSIWSSYSSMWWFVGSVSAPVIM